MSKKLNFTVKNTQLAAALKMNKQKREEKSAALEKAEKEKLKPPAPPKEDVVIKEVKATSLPQEGLPPPKKVEIPPVKKEEAIQPVLPLQAEQLPGEKEEISIAKAKTVISTVEKKAEGAKPIPYEPSKKKPVDFSAIDESEGFKSDASRAPKDTKIKRIEPKRTGFDTRHRSGLQVPEEQHWRKRRPKQKGLLKKPIEVIRPKELEIRLPISIKDLAHAMKLKASELIEKLFLQGITLRINDFLDDETMVQLLGHDFHCEITIDTKEESRLKITSKSIQEEILETPADQLVTRPPVVAFMGHVDHGKTSLIDSIRKSNLAGAESGAITQHIGAFRCHRENGDIIILDTPGHEAFSLMRKRGVTITDIVIIVVAGDEGIMAQTDEAIKQARDANVPMIIALNKCDKPNFNQDNVYRQLADRELLPEAWGGSIITINCSAATGKGIPELLEMLLLQAEVLELKANPNTRARGTVIESQLHKGFGVMATVLIQNGTLRINDALVFDQIYARVKTMHDEHGKALTVAPPSTPIKITGISDIPEAGCEFIAVKNEKEARKLCEERSSGEKTANLQRVRTEGFEHLMQRQQELSEKKILNLIIRADVQGSVEAIKNSLLNIRTKKVEIHFVAEGVGEISESDIELAAASHAVIIGFHTQVESHAENLIKRTKVVIKKRDIIYQIIDDVKELMLNLLDKVRQETEMGMALVKQVFKVSGQGVIAGCQVADGIIKRNHYAKVYREGHLVWEGKIGSLKRVKEDVKEVIKGLECGILLERFSDVMEGDQIKAYEVTFLQQEL